MRIIHINYKVCGQTLPLLVQGSGDKDKVKLQPEVETASLMQISAAPGNKSSTKSLTKKICVDDILFDIQISQAFDGTCVRVWLTGPKILRKREALSSLRAKRAGLKGLRAESARAVTGRRCPHSGRGEDFLTGQLNFFTETAVTPERKFEKLFPRLEINRHAGG